MQSDVGEPQFYRARSARHIHQADLDAAGGPCVQAREHQFIVIIETGHNIGVQACGGQGVIDQVNGVGT